MKIKGVKYKEKERILRHALAQARPLTNTEAFIGSSPAPFVGKYGYPNVNVGILAPPEHDEKAWLYDAPKTWAETNSQIAQIVNYRTRMVNSRFQSNIKNHDKLVQIAQEVAMATKPVDLDIALQKKPSLNIKTDQWVAPMGPQASLKKISLASNPKIPTKVQKYYDDEILTTEAITTLYKKNIDENFLSKMLSVGIFGKQKKLVPTRWSITATDDIISKKFLEKIREQPIGEYEAYFGNYLGNYYLILFFQEKWRYELFELYTKPGLLEYSTDYEEHQGRKNYAENCAGGYYTVRSAITEHLANNKRQNGVLAIRLITDDYVLPLGVWVTREATKKALSNKPIKFGNKELMLTYAKHVCKNKFGVDITPIIQRSKILSQKVLDNFI